MIIPRIRSTGSPHKIEAKNLKEALDIWSSLREHAGEMHHLRDQWTRLHNNLPPDVAPPRREAEIKEFYHHAGNTIGDLSTEVLEKILEDIANV